MRAPGHQVRARTSSSDCNECLHMRDCELLGAAVSYGRGPALPAWDAGLPCPPPSARKEPGRAGVPPPPQPTPTAAAPGLTQSRCPSKDGDVDALPSWQQELEAQILTLLQAGPPRSLPGPPAHRAAHRAVRAAGPTPASDPAPTRHSRPLSRLAATGPRGPAPCARRWPRAAACRGRPVRHAAPAALIPIRVPQQQGLAAAAPAAPASEAAAAAAEASAAAAP